MRLLASALMLLVAAKGLAAEGARPSVLIHCWPEDSDSAALVPRVTDSLARRAVASGRRTSSDPRVDSWLDHAPEDLARAAAAFARGKTDLAEGIEAFTRLRLEASEESLLRARKAFTEAAIVQPYDELSRVHFHLGIIAVNLRQSDSAAAHFRLASLLAPGRNPDRRHFAPSVVDAFAEAKRAVTPRGALRTESNPPGVALFLDGQPVGNAPKTLADVAIGDHYVEFRAPGRIPLLQTVSVRADAETVVNAALELAGRSLRESWREDRAAPGIAALAKLSGNASVAFGTVRRTVAGVAPHEVRGALFDASGRRVSSEETTLPADADGIAAKLTRIAGAVFQGPASTTSVAASGAARGRILPRDSALVVFEAGGAYSSFVYDSHGRQIRGAPLTFRDYVEVRAQLHVRYGVRENVTVFASLPFLSKYVVDRNVVPGPDDNGDGEPDYYTVEETPRDDAGLGDTTLGADFRLHAFQRGSVALAWAGVRLKLPTGNDATEGSLWDYNTLVMGSGQVDLTAAAGVVFAGDRSRLAVEGAYVARLPDRVGYHNSPRFRQHLNPGDEQRLRIEGAIHAGRWITPQLYADLMHRNTTEGFIDPVSYQIDAREMFLVNAGFGLHAEFSERAEAGFSVQHPVWGKITQTFFPLDVTGPRASLYFGVRL